MHVTKALAVTAFIAGACACVVSGPYDIAGTTATTAAITGSENITTATIETSQSLWQPHVDELDACPPLQSGEVFTHINDATTTAVASFISSSVVIAALPTEPLGSVVTALSVTDTTTGIASVEETPISQPRFDKLPRCIPNPSFGGCVWTHINDAPTTEVASSTPSSVVVGALLTEPRGSVVIALSVAGTTGVVSIEGTTLSWRHNGITLDNGDVVSVVFDGIADSTTTADYQEITLGTNSAPASNDIVTMYTTTLTTETVPVVLQESANAITTPPSRAASPHDNREDVSRLKSILASFSYTVTYRSHRILVTGRDQVEFRTVTETQKVTAPPMDMTTVSVTGEAEPTHHSRKHKQLGHKSSAGWELHILPDGVSIVQTTVLVTVTSTIDSAAPSGTKDSTSRSAPASAITTLTDPINPTLTEVLNSTTTTCINNTSIDTVSYDNPLTFSMSGLTSSTNATASSEVTSGSFSPENGTSVVTSSSSVGDTLGYTGAIASNIVSVASKAVQLDGFHLPALVVAAMAACFGLVLLL